MKLYAIRDRLLEYFQRPFIGDTDATVLAAVAAAINQGDNKVDFAQAPTHFEVWQLAEISEESGQVRPAPKFISNCSDLRRGIREDRIHRAAEGQEPAPGRRTTTEGPPTYPGAPDRGPEGTTQSQTAASGEGGQRPEGTSLTS